MSKSKSKSKDYIHITDMSDYTRCRRSWHWSSIMRRGLQPAVPPPPLYLGQGVHVGLDHGYRGSVVVDPGDDATMSFDQQAAAQAFSDWAKDRTSKVVEYTGGMWESEQDAVKTIRSLALTMILHYSLWAHTLDSVWQLLGTERKFSLPLPESDLWYAGRFDGLVKHKSSGDIYVLEFKTARSISDRDMSGTFRSMQPTAYLWAARQIYGQDVQGILYRVLWKRVPDNPKPLATGGFSRAQSQKSTFEWIKFVLDQMADASISATVYGGSTEELRQDYYKAALNVLRLMQSRQSVDGLTVRNGFFLQRPIVKTPYQIADMLTCLRELGREMLDPRTLIFPVAGYHCSWCKFRGPCDLHAIGLPVEAEAVLAAEYAPRDYWEEEEPR